MFDKLLISEQLAQIAQINRHLVKETIYEYRHLVVAACEVSLDEVAAQIRLYVQLILTGRERVDREDVELLSKYQNHTVY